MPFFARRRRTFASTSSSNSRNTTSRTSNTVTTPRRASASSADLRRSAFGLAMPARNWNARKQSTVTYRPAFFNPTGGDEYMIMLPGNQGRPKNCTTAQYDNSLEGWNDVSLFGNDGSVQFDPMVGAP